MLGVDRLDMIKGIPQKLLAFEMFLEKNPEWREKVMLVQIAVPTRTDVQECRCFFLIPLSLGSVWTLLTFKMRFLCERLLITLGRLGFMNLLFLLCISLI